MGRELRRVPLDFDWPLEKPYKGFINPHYTAVKCSDCEASGYSPEALRMHKLWYGYLPFKPADRGSTPFTPDHPVIRRMAYRNVTVYFDSNDDLKQRDSADPGDVCFEALRLCAHFNSEWLHHLNQQDVDALIAAGRLMELTHEWTKGKGWQKRDPSVHPTAKQVNEWA